MRVQVNGETRELEEGLTVLGLLESLGLKPSNTVVERNAVILDRSRCGEVKLKDGDRIELVRFVGGG